MNDSLKVILLYIGFWVIVLSLSSFLIDNKQIDEPECTPNYINGCDL